MREALLATGKQMVEQGRYFTIFAPRQSGKTTYFRLLSERIKEDGYYLPVWLSIDILILFRGRKYIIETRIFTTQYAFQKGKRQLAEYLTAEGLDEGYYVVFSKKHTEQDQLDLEDDIQGKRIYSLIVCTQFERATDQHVTD